MKFWEAMKALEEGEKVQEVGAGPNSYLQILNGRLKNSRGDEVSLDMGYVLGRVVWQIYEEPKPKKQVYQWRYKSFGRWILSLNLRTKTEAATRFSQEYEIHAGPFEVVE
jgi:hypothetical protein